MKGRYDTKVGQAVFYMALLVLAFAAMAMLRHCSSPPVGAEKQQIASGGDTLDVAITYSPMTFYRYADTLGGFSYDLLRVMASDGDFVFKYHPVSSTSKALQGLKDGLYDILVSDLARTSEVGNDFAFTSDVYFDRQVLVQPKSIADSGATVKSQLDLAKKRVWVEESTPAYWRLKHLSAEIGDTIFIETDNRYTSEQIMVKVAVGDVPLAVVNERVAKILAPDYPQIDISTSVSFTQFQSWVVRAADKSLLARLNASLDSIKVSDRYVELSRRYGVE